MRAKVRARLTYANVMSTMAVFMVLGGVAWAAALPRNSVGTKQLKRNAVTSKKIKNGQVTGADVRNGQVTGADVKDHTLTASEFAAGTQLQGPPGKDGKDGADGAPGTARAYATVSHDCTGPAGNETCPVFNAKGVSEAVRVVNGVYCVRAPGIDPATTPAVVSVYWANTNAPEGNTSVEVAGPCTGGDRFQIVTERQTATPVRDAADTGTTSVAGNASESNTVAFIIAIP